MTAAREPKRKRKPAAPTASAPSPAELFETALAAHQARRFEDAADGYRRILDVVPDHADALTNLGNALRQLGRLEDAVSSYRRAVAVRGDAAEPWYNLANALVAQGETEAAADAYRKALERRPDLAAARFNLGNLLRDQGELEEAAACYRAALPQLGRLPRLHTNLGNVLNSLGRHEEAATCHRRAIALDPDYAEAHYNLGNALRASGDREAAIDAYRRTVALKPTFVPARHNLGAVLAEAGRCEEAETVLRAAAELDPGNSAVQLLLGRACHARHAFDSAIAAYRAALAADPGLAAAYGPLAMALNACGKRDEAISTLERAIASHPADAELHANLGTLYNLAGRIPEAMAALTEAVRLKPEYPVALSNLAYTLIVQGRLSEAVARCEAALAIRPDYVDALSNLGFALGNQARLDESAAAFRRALAIDPGYYKAHSNLLFLLNYGANNDPSAVAAEHRAWGDSAIAAAPPPAVWENSPDPERRLRIGYLSPDFRQHSVAHFIEPLLAHHDREAMETFCYAHVPAPDAVTERIRGHADHWRDIADLDDAAVVEAVRGDRIDILVDLAGHTASNRLPVFARQPAPVQATYLGYPNTSGLTRIGYRLTDAVADPPGSEGVLYAEALLRLPRCFLAYRAPHTAPAVAPSPARERGRVTFGSFNNLAKVTPEVIALWARLLRKIPDSRLLIKAGALADPPTQQRILAMFGAEDIDPRRVRAFGYLPEIRDHLAFYANIDIALDSFPYNGTTTTCEALWMGVPVVTLAGTVHAARVGASLLAAVGLEEFVAADRVGYLECAAALAADHLRLDTLRSELRPRMAASPLCDAAGLAGAVEDAYRRMWRNNCRDPI